MSESPWKLGAGAWAAEAERADEEEREQAVKAAAEAASIPATQSQNFPSLKDAGNVKQSKKKTKMSLQEFNKQSSYAVGLTPEEMTRLPTGPRERSSADEMPYGSRLGGGFSNYGSRPSGPPPGRTRDGDNYGSEGSWGGSRRSYGGFEDETRQSRGPRPEFDQTSRADEVDNWSTMKKPLPSFSSGPGGGPGPRPSRYASLGGGIGGPSKADEVEDWVSTKKTMPPPATRSYAFGSGVRESRPEPDRWTRGANPERQSLSLDVSKDEEGGGIVKVNKPNPFGAARPREEVLAGKGVDWKKFDMDIEAKAVSRPTSSHSSRPGSSQSNRSEGQALQGIGEVSAKPKTKVNPFGDAKPREVFLEERGVDWKKIDLELDHRRVERPETDEEKNLKEEIQHLKDEMSQKSSEDQSSLHDVILQKEKDLELLICDLDDKIRFGQKVTERPGSGAGRPSSGAGRPGSGAGRFAASAERTSSQPGAYEDHRGNEFVERPRSRGSVDAWPRSVDDRRPQRGRGRGYSGGRGDLERPLSRERW